MKNTLALAFFLLISLVLFRPLHADPNACKGSCPGTDLCCTNNASLSCQSESTCKTPKGTGTGVCIKKCPEASGGCTKDSECGTNKCYLGQCVICIQDNDCQSSGKICANNQCVATPTPNKCGSSTCKSNEQCQAGQCVPVNTTPPATEDNSPAYCDMNDPLCASGMVCKNWQCVAKNTQCRNPFDWKCVQSGYSNNRAFDPNRNPSMTEISNKRGIDTINLARLDQSCDPTLEVEVHSVNTFHYLKITYQAPCATKAHLWGPLLPWNKANALLIKPQWDKDPDQESTKWQPIADQKVAPCDDQKSNCYQSSYNLKKKDPFDFSGFVYVDYVAGETYDGENNWRVDVPASAGKKTGSTQSVYTQFFPFLPLPNDPKNYPKLHLAVLQKDGWRVVEKIIDPSPPEIHCDVTIDTEKMGFNLTATVGDYSIYSAGANGCAKTSSSVSGTQLKESYFCPMQETQTIGCHANGVNILDWVEKKDELKLTAPAFKLNFVGGSVAGVKDPQPFNTIKDLQGDITLKYSVERQLEVNNQGQWGEDSDSSITYKNKNISVPWVKDLVVAADSSCPSTKTLSGQEASVTSDGIPFGGLVVVPRNYNCYDYTLSGHGLDGKALSTVTVDQDLSYQGKFTAVVDNHQCKTHVDHFDGTCDECSCGVGCVFSLGISYAWCKNHCTDDSDTTVFDGLDYTLKFATKHVKKVAPYCYSDYGKKPIPVTTGKFTPVSAASTPYSAADTTIQFNGSIKDPKKQTSFCVLAATYYDGTSDEQILYGMPTCGQ